MIRQLQGVLDHTGYEFPYDPLAIVPGVGGTKFHDDHHKYFQRIMRLVFPLFEYGDTLEEK